MSLLCQTITSLLMIAALGTLGCKPKGPPVAKVTGSVKLNGQPVSAGVVIFQSEDGTQAVMGNLAADGKFEMRTHEAEGIAPGKYKVALKPPPPSYETPPLADAAMNDPRPIDKTIPQKFHSSETSGLTAEVRLDQPNDFKFDLKP